uniref:Transmembrane protein n=1 Tax=Steinernema glaseri TaxID=37863 RepID=A0A1I7YG01_9BILA
MTDVERLEVPTPEQLRTQTHKKYKRVCCICCCLRAKDATIVGALTTMVIAIGCLLRVRFSGSLSQDFFTSLTVLFDIIWMGTSVVAIYACAHDRATLLGPFLLMVLLLTVLLPFLFVISFVALLLIEHAGKPDRVDESDVEPWIYRMVASTFGMPLTIYFTFVVRRCYYDFKNMAKGEVDSNMNRRGRLA